MTGITNPQVLPQRMAYPLELEMLPAGNLLLPPRFTKHNLLHSLWESMLVFCFFILLYQRIIASLTDGKAAIYQQKSHFLKNGFFYLNWFSIFVVSKPIKTIPI